jgi:PhzF family phenazine biosynthesis protein
MSTSTTHHLLVPVSSVEALDRAVVQRDKLVEQLDLLDSRAHGIFWFTPVAGADGVPTFHARFFSRGMTAEDPATGSAAGPLSAYLYRNGVVKLDEQGKLRIVVYQGLKLGRECVIEVKLALRKEGGEEVLEVDIVGGGAEVARGEIELPALSTSF